MPPTSIDSVPVATPAPTLPTSERPSSDEATALDLVTSYETARSENRFADAWNLLAPRSQLRLGTLARYADGERAFNEAGGDLFELMAPTQDGETITLLAGGMEAEIRIDAEFERGWLVSVSHPGIQAASLGTTVLFVAPLRTGDWRIWIVK